MQVTPLGPVPVQGVAAPRDVFELVGASGIWQRLQATAARGLTRFVGRDTELATLGQALASAEAGHGQVVALVGEAGVGKSRRVYEGVHAHHLQGWRVLESASVSYGKATPYFPIIDLRKRSRHVDDSDDPRTSRAKLTGQILTLDESLHDTLPALLAILDALPADSPFAQRDPPQRRQRTRDAFKRVRLRESQVQPLASLQMPATVQAVLAARIDRLPPEEKRLLQTAAVMGNEVSLPLLQAIAEPPEDALHHSLTHLQAAEFLYETRLFPERAYTLKHALTHEVAYGSLLQERRRARHAHIVEALEAFAGDRVAEQVERLAHHAVRGEVWDKALAYCRQAGEKAMARSAYREAVNASSRRSVPSRLCRRRATRVSRPSISGSPCARRSFRLAT